MKKKTIIVIGATDSHGKGVAHTLFNRGAYHDRAVTRNPEDYSGQAHEAVKANGKDYSFTHMPGNVFSTFFEGSKEITEMFGYFEKYAYMSPNSRKRIDLAKQTTKGDFLSFEEWIKGGN